MRLFLILCTHGARSARLAAMATDAGMAARSVEGGTQWLGDILNMR